MLTASEAREMGTDAGEVVVFDVHTSPWTATGDMDTGRPVWEYLSRVMQGDLLIGVPKRMSVYGFDWPKRYRAPTHFHDVDQIQVVVAGELHMGSHVLRYGQGVYTPAGRAYNFSTGVNGAMVLEFRDRPGFQTAYKERDVAMLGRPIRLGGMVDPDPSLTPQTAIPGWTAPDNVGKPSFFDAETAPLVAAPSGEAAALPRELVGKVRYQELLVPPASSSYTLVGVDVGGSVTVPSHAQSCPRVLYVLAGQAQVGDVTLRQGQGLYVPAGTALAFEAGAVGLHYIAFRDCTSWVTTW